MKSLRLNQRETVFALAAVGVMTLVMADASVAQQVIQDTSGAFSQSQVGVGVKTAFSDLLKGNIGLVVGVFFAVFGAYMWLVKQETMVGIGSIVFGAVIALSDNLLSGMVTTITRPLLGLFGGGR